MTTRKPAAARAKAEAPPTSATDSAAKPKPARKPAAKTKAKPAAKPKPAPKPEASEVEAEALALAAEAEAEAKRHRASDAEVAEREAEALALLMAGHGTASTSRILSERHGVTLRMARNYTRAASLDYLESLGDMSPQEIEFRSLHNSHCLERIAEQSAEAGESMTAIRARTALASVLARLQILASTPSHPEANGGKPRRRIRLGDSRGSGLPIPDGVIW